MNVNYRISGITIALISIFYLGCYAQRVHKDKVQQGSDCGILEFVFRDTAIRNALELSSKENQTILLFNRDTAHFQNCEYLHIDNYTFRVVNFNLRRKFEGRWLTIGVGDSTNANRVDLWIDDEAREKWGFIRVAIVNKAYKIIDFRIDSIE